MSCVRYGESFGFLGQYIVRSDCRGQGFGLIVWQAGMAHLAGRVVGLDGVLNQVANYERSGFRFAHHHVRYEGTGGGKRPDGLVSLADVPFDTVVEYDGRCFPARREAFLRGWLNLPESVALGCVRNRNLTGYGVLRKSTAGHKVGPLFADDPETAEQLLGGLIAAIPGRPFCIDMPEPRMQPAVSKFVRVFGFRPRCSKPPACIPANPRRSMSPACSVSPPSNSAENHPMTEFRYPTGNAHGGRLEYQDSIPILVVQGGPDEVGRQIGELAVRPAIRLLDYPLDYLRSQVRIPLLPRLLWALLKRPCRRLFTQIPERQRAEIEAIARCGFDGTRLVAANTLFDMGHIGLRPLFGCSSFVVPPARSATGGLLFGRNLDFFPLGYLHEYSLVTVYRPTATTLGFASLGFPGNVGCFSGMNSAGLCLARHEVLAPAVARKFNPAGVPFAAVLREVMETCHTVGEAIALLERTRHATVNIVILADITSAKVVELTPDGVFERAAAGGLIGCTNHFLHPVTTNPEQPNAFHTVDRLAALRRYTDTASHGLGLADVWAALNQVHQGEMTLQTMVFEPATRSIHVAFGSGPTTSRTPVRIDLNAFLGHSGAIPNAYHDLIRTVLRGPHTFK